MNRRSFMQVAALIGGPWSGLSAFAAHTTKAAPATESAMRIAKATAAALAMQRRDWEHGALAQALLEAGDRERVILLAKAAIVQRTADGRLAVVNGGSPTDPSMGGAAYAQAAEWTGDVQMRQASDGLLEWIRHGAPRAADGVLSHVFHGAEMWSDGFNCAPPYLAAMGFYDEALAQIEGYKKRLWNREKQLLAHIWDDGKQKLNDASFWGGGNGWAAAGVARVIGHLPSARSVERAQLAEFVRQILDGCLAHQRPDGLFYNVIDQPSSFVETNLAQMLAFAAYRGVKQGWLPASYRAHADRMRAAAREKMDAYGLVQGACGAPGFDRPGVSTEAQAFSISMEAAGAAV